MTYKFLCYLLTLDSSILNRSPFLVSLENGHLDRDLEWVYSGNSVPNLCRLLSSSVDVPPEDWLLGFPPSQLPKQNKTGEKHPAPGAGQLLDKGRCNTQTLTRQYRPRPPLFHFWWGDFWKCFTVLLGIIWCFGYLSRTYNVTFGAHVSFRTTLILLNTSHCIMVHSSQIRTKFQSNSIHYFESCFHSLLAALHNLKQVVKTSLFLYL